MPLAVPGGRDGGGRGTAMAVASSVVVAIILAVGGVLGYTYLRAGGASGPPSQGNSQPASHRSAAPSPTRDLAKLDTVSTDPKPLNLREAFPSVSPVVGGVTYHRVHEVLNHHCSAAGQKRFGKVLKRADCLRVLRATYVDSAKRYAVTIGVAVLATKSKAQHVVRRADPSAYVWFRPLAGPHGSGAARIGKSGGYAAIVPVGHYVAFAFAAHADGRPPKGHDAPLIKRSNEMRSYVVKPLLRRALRTPPQHPPG